MPKQRNHVARSPLLKKGGVHQRARSGERQQHRKATKQAIEAALRERRSRFWGLRCRQVLTSPGCPAHP